MTLDKKIMYFSTGIYELGIPDNLIDHNLIVGKYLNLEMVFTCQKKNTSINYAQKVFIRKQTE